MYFIVFTFSRALKCSGCLIVGGRGKGLLYLVPLMPAYLYLFLVKGLSLGGGFGEGGGSVNAFKV